MASVYTSLFIVVATPQQITVSACVGVKLCSPWSSYPIRGNFRTGLFSYNSNNQQSNESKTCLKISPVITRLDTWSFAVILSLDRYGVASFLSPHRFFKPAKVDFQLNPGPVRDADEAELRLKTKTSSKGRGDYTKFTTKQQAIIVHYARKHGIRQRYTISGRN